jgi:iron(III) transport system permease protein
LQGTSARPRSILRVAGYSLLLVAVVLPFATLFGQMFAADASGLWMHYASTVLPGYVANSVVLGASVALVAATTGVACAWQIERYRFPGRDLLSWALLLPMAMPAYVAAYALTDFFQFSGPLQSSLRATFGWSKGDYWFPELVSMPGAITVFSLTLYPYVYLLARAAFAERGAELFEAARTLGLNRRAAWWRAALPVARPAIAGGALLVIMETLADFGTVSYFGVETLTTGIYRAWQNMGDLVAAAQLAAVLLAAVMLLVWQERRSRLRARYASTRARATSIQHDPSRPAAWSRTFWCALPLVLGFVLPSVLLLRLLAREWTTLSFAPVLRWTGNSLLVGLLAALVVVSLALTLHARARLLREGWALRIERLLSFGYAVPGAVLAIGVLLPLAWLDNQIIDASKRFFTVNPGLLLTGSVLALVYASSIRFYGVASSSVASAYARLPLNLDDSARVLGASGWNAFLRVHWPALKRSALAATLLVFIDTLKELPATLTLRPFNFDTLATQTYNLVKDERLGEAAFPSLLIVLASLPAVALLARFNSRAADSGAAGARFNQGAQRRAIPD